MQVKKKMASPNGSQIAGAPLFLNLIALLFVL
jgi:hypothetical protein